MMTSKITTAGLLAGAAAALLGVAIGIELLLRLEPVPEAKKSTEIVPFTSTIASSTSQGYKKVMATVFWVGEQPSEDNAYISNVPSYWDDQWQEHFGGVDSGACRSGYVPCSFTPKENVFYVALPYGEREIDSDALKKTAAEIPWFGQTAVSGQPLLKNHWVEVRMDATLCYGQLEDVGPYENDDFAYVFGSSRVPKNQFGVKAGIDLSPALFTGLGLDDNARVEWRFVDATAVPDGPWKSTVTTRGVSFN